MRGTIRKRSDTSHTLIVDEGRDPVTGKRRQRWIAVRGTLRDAEKALNKLVRDVDTNDFVRPSKRTVAEWITEWLAAIKPTARRRTYKAYSSAAAHLTKALGTRPLQSLRRIDAQRYFGERHGTLAPATLTLHKAVLSAALQAAVDNGHLSRNIIAGAKKLVSNERKTVDALEANVLDVEESRALLTAAAAAGPRRSAFYALAIDSGARLGELCAVKWTDIDLDARRLTISRQLLSVDLVDDQLDFGPLKRGTARSIDLGPETITRLRALKKHQAAITLRHRDTARSWGLVFTLEPEDLFLTKYRCGDPLRIKTLGGDLDRLLKAAEVTKAITFHGLRHTSATLLLVAGQNPKVVSERLGHAKVSLTLDLYSHLLPSLGRSAADSLGALLYG